MKAMTNIDICVICTELNNLLTGARVDKSFQPTSDTIVMRFHVPGTGRVDLVMQAGYRIHTTQYPIENPKIPPSFPMLLRKRLKGAHVISINQLEFDRIIEIKIKKEKYYSIIIELFNKGNIILIDDENNIIAPLKRSKTKSRNISSKEEYKLPEKQINPIEITEEELTNFLNESDRDVVRTLSKISLGGIYSEEIIFRANQYEKIDKNSNANELNEKQIKSLHKGFKEVLNPIKTEEFKAQIVKGKKEDVIPIDLIEYNEYEKTYFKNFNEACDEFYSEKINTDIVSIKEKAWNKKVNKYKRMLSKQQETLDNFNNTIETCQHKGEVIYSNYTIIENLINVINQAISKNYSFKEINKILINAKKEGMEEAQIYESMDKLGNITLKIDDTSININPKESIPENAEIYYEKAKKSKRKTKGAIIAIENTKKKLKDIEEKKDDAMEHIEIPKKRVKKELKWYEKLRWFLSSDNHLIIAGRDTSTNERVVKNYLENNDIYLHADIYGASSTVIKNANNSLSDQLIKESAEFAASYSSAWKNNFTNQDVYWIYPDQVSKQAESGQYLSKGSFAIRGKKNYIRSAKLQIAIGIVNYEGKRIMAGPVDALEKHTSNYVVLKPGFTKKEALAKKIIHKINEDNLITIDDIVRILPAGKSDFDEEYWERKRFK